MCYRFILVHKFSCVASLCSVFIECELQNLIERNRSFRDFLPTYLFIFLNTMNFTYYSAHTLFCRQVCHFGLSSRVKYFNAIIAM